MLWQITIGGYDIDFPIGERWVSAEGVLLEGTDILKIFIGFSVVIAVAMIIVSGYTLITAAGNPDKIEQGQKTLTAAIVGLVVVFLAALIIQFVLTSLGVT